MTPLLELIQPLVRRFMANKLAMSVTAIGLIAIAILTDVGRGGGLVVMALLALSAGLAPRDRR